MPSVSSHSGNQRLKSTLGLNKLTCLDFRAQPGPSAASHMIRTERAERTGFQVKCWRRRRRRHEYKRKDKKSLSDSQISGLGRENTELAVCSNLCCFAPASMSLDVTFSQERLKTDKHGDYCCELQVSAAAAIIGLLNAARVRAEVIVCLIGNTHRHTTQTKLFARTHLVV